MARRGSFATGTAPFGSGAPLSDLSEYQIGAPQSAPQPAPQPTPASVPGWYTPAEAPPKPTVAPEVGTMPQPVIPKPVSPYVTLREEREAIASRAAQTGHLVTAANVTTTQFRNPSATLAAELAAIEARARASGHDPTAADIQRTYLNNLARAAGG